MVRLADIVGKVNVHRARINFWDLGGQKQLQSIWEKYYDDCHAIVFVVDATDRERIDECRITLEKVIRNDIVDGVPVLMLANKQDLPGALKLHEIKEIFNQIALQLEARDSKVLCVSALTGF
jgi:ADP-ribosylation factor related protein 1